MLLLTLLLACGPDQALLDEKTALEGKVKALEQENASLREESSTLKKRVSLLERSVETTAGQEIWGKLGIPEGGTLDAVLDTSKGEIRCRLFPKLAPLAVLNFVELAEGKREWTDPKTGQKTNRKLYDGTLFHRVIPGFMAQGGDPLGTGMGGPGYRFHDEIHADLQFDKPGRLAMANVGPDTNGSQFFVTEAPRPDLNGRHTIFGECPEAVPVVKAITGVPRDDKDRPKTDVALKKVKILRSK